MVRNQSAPTDRVLPHIMYQNVADALVWLTRTFGFKEHYRYVDPSGGIEGAQIHLGEIWIMLHPGRQQCGSPAQVGYRTQNLTIFVDDVDSHYERAKSAGARIVEELRDTSYGEREYGAEDLEGHPWFFSQHIRNVKPEEWGATTAASFDPMEVEGRVESTWMPRSYAVETDPGAITGAQGSIYARAMAAVEQMLALLDGLYASVSPVEAGELEKHRALVRGQLVSMVDELGAVDGPRVSRVDEAFRLLLGPGQSSLSLLKQLLGLGRTQVSSVGDEQNITNYLILVDYAMDLQASWKRVRGLFVTPGR